ncbi:MAG TPA: trypsin-like peptidase domain-containing protein [Jiangellales bacterium]|nr:trypsin-like peptidase domain-containing protein [Jiangellales bacterium]
MTETRHLPPYGQADAPTPPHAGTGWATGDRADDPSAAPTPPWGPSTPAGPPPSPRRPARRGYALLAALALGAGLVGGAAGGAAYTALDDSTRTTTESSLDVAPGSTDVGDRSDGGAAMSSVEDVAAAVLPSVVSVQVRTGAGPGTGSGVVLSSDGLILTNNHVVEAASSGGQVVVSFQDGTTATATVVGLDPLTDLAVLQAEDVDGLTSAALGSSSDLAVGEQVVAIGSPLGLDGTVTTGIVSALQRPVRTTDAGPDGSTVIDAVQTDAPINPGNSGGPLVNMAGEVVGINSAIATAPGSQGSIGLGFSIPIDQARPIAEELRDSGTATHARLGVSVGDPADGSPGALVASVEPDGAAETAGIQEGDVVTRVGDRQLADGDELVAAVRSYRPGESVEVTVSRGGETRTVEVTLGSDGAGG